MAAARRTLLSTVVPQGTNDEVAVDDEVDEEDDNNDQAPLVFSATAYPHGRRSLSPRPKAKAFIIAGTLIGLPLLLLLLLVNRNSDTNNANIISSSSSKAKSDILRQALQLTPIQTQIVHRHGDRTPITPLENESFWASLLPTEQGLDDIGKHTKIIRQPDFKPHPAGGGAVYGRLTRDGMARMEALGKHLQSDVLERLMPGHQHDLKVYLQSVDPATWLRVSSTDFSRTIQSVQMLLLGLFPIMPSAGIEVDARHTLKMIPDPNPRRFIGQAERERELVHSSEFVAKEKNMKPLAIRVTKMLFDTKVLGEAALNISFGVGEDEASIAAEKPEDLGNSNNAQHILAWNQLAEILICLENVGRLPKDITTQELKDVAEHNAWRWFALLKDGQLAAMAIKSLAKKMIMNGAEALPFQADQSLTPPPLLHIFSGHDATLISLLCFFKIERPSVWPEYGSYLKMEFLRDDQGILGTTPDKMNTGKAKYVVLFSLNGEPLQSSFGNNDGSKSFFVPWLNFERELVDIERGLPPLAVPNNSS